MIELTEPEVKTLQPGEAIDLTETMPIATYRGVEAEYLRFIYDAVCNQGVDINSDATKAFYEGAKYGANLARDAMLQGMVNDLYNSFSL